MNWARYIEGRQPYPFDATAAPRTVKRWMSERETSRVEAVYIDGDSPAEIFRAAAQWAAENDGGFAGIEALGWIDYGPYENQDGFGLQIYYEPKPIGHGGGEQVPSTPAG